jgi:uncharacterized protein (TIGR00661 family)
MKTVLVAVLDWGLGHATRSIPIIRELQNQHVRVVLAGNGASLSLLKQEFPLLKYYELPDYGIRYPEKSSILWALMKQIPRLKRVLKAEFKQVADVVKKEKVDAIISDNRYGCFQANIQSIIICHQLNLQLPNGWHWLSPFVNAWHEKYLLRFNQIWVPDMPYKSMSFSGELSQSDLPDVKRIGILSRFGESSNAYASKFDLVAIVSGPEPQRSVFENMIRNQLRGFKGNALLVKGLPEHKEYTFAENITEVNHLEANELDQVLRDSKIVLSRAGYSTVMDLATLGKKAILIPTPGQTEQEYLARFLSGNAWVVAREQKNFDLNEALKALDKLNSIPHVRPNAFLSKAITDLVCRC